MNLGQSFQSDAKQMIQIMNSNDESEQCDQIELAESSEEENSERFGHLEQISHPNTDPMLSEAIISEFRRKEEEMKKKEAELEQLRQ